MHDNKKSECELIICLCFDKYHEFANVQPLVGVDTVGGVVLWNETGSYF